MHLSWGSVTQLYSRHLYASINSRLPRVRFEGDIWPPMAGISIRMALDANDFGWGGNTMEDAPQYAREYFLVEERSQSSTYRELLGVYKC